MIIAALVVASEKGSVPRPSMLSERIRNMSLWNDRQRDATLAEFESRCCLPCIVLLLIYIYIYMYVCMYVYIYIYIYALSLSLYIYI